MNTVKHYLNYELGERKRINKNNIFHRVYIVRTLDNRCSVCGGNLKQCINALPIDDSYSALVNGMCCKECKAFFVKYTDNLNKLIKEKKEHLKGYHVYYSDYRYHEFYDRNPNALALMIGVNLNNRRRRFFLICKEEVYNEGLSTLVMSEPLVAPLIDYAYGKREGDIISFEGERYKIIKCLKKKNKMIEEKYDGSLDLRANAIRIDTLYVAPNGGYFTMEEFHEGIELVYVLLFSPYTQRYELTQATYYKSKNRYGMDIGLFKSFVEEYGKPDVELRFREPGGTPGEFGYDLRDESILRAWGYSVAAQDDLSPDTRQNILAYIVDLGIMNVAQIVRFLYFLVESRKDGKYSEARKKWMEDILFIQSYRVNPERFIIPDMIVRK